MFPIVRAELAARSAQVAELVRLADSLEQREVQTIEPGLRSLKGLLFVQFYSVYEFVVVNAFLATIRQFNSYQIPFERVRRCLLALALTPEFHSLRDSNERRCWPTKFSLIAKFDSAERSAISEALFPTDESHFRPAQLDTIANILGMVTGSLLPSPALIGWINEVVENRNAIAHGRDTAQNIGSRYSIADLIRRQGNMNLLCNHITTALEVHSSNILNFQA